MKKLTVLYVIIDKESDKISIDRYLNNNIPYYLNLNLRKVQRIFATKDKIETDKYIVHKVYNIDLGNRGGKRIKNNQNEW